MTYVREQTSAELEAHMRRLQAMPGWHDPLADRLWQEVQSVRRDMADLIEQQAARIAELEAQIATVAPAVDAQPVANDVPRGNDALFAHVTDWMNTHRIPFEAQNELFRILAASPQSEGWRKDAVRREALEEIAQALTAAGEHSAYEIVYRALAKQDTHTNG